MDENYSLSDIRAACGSRNEGMFGGGDWGAWIILFLIFGLFGGWGGGYGGFGGGNGSGFQGYATRADINEGFALNNLQGGITAIQQGLCDTTYALNNTITNGFNTVTSQLASCCCDTQRAIDGVNYNLAAQSCDTRNTIQTAARDILDNQNSNTRAILDFLTNDKIATLTAENQSLRFQASQTAQNQFITQVGSDIVNRLAPAAIPAYQVPNPYTGCGYGYGSCGGCN